MHTQILKYHKTVTLDLVSCYESFLPISERNYTRWLNICGNIFDDTVCTLSERGDGICNGDSGGPLVAKYNNYSEDVFVGIVSWGLDCEEGYPNVFTSVFHHLDFIRDQISY